MKKNDFWFLSLCALIVISANTGLNIPLRIALGANAIVVLIDVAKTARRICNERNEEKK